MTQNKPVKAVVATVKIGNREIQGLELPDKSFAVAIPQIQKLCDDFLDTQKYASQKLKRLLGKEFKTHKAKTDFNKNTTNIVSLKQFEIILAKLDRAGSIKAQDLRDELAGLSMHQLFCDAFDRKFQQEERQQWLLSRQQSKITRRSFTTVVKDYVIAHRDQLSDNYKKFIYTNCTDAINRIIFGRSAKKLREDWNCDDYEIRNDH